ncbi:MAG: tRNA pseudouridine32 synthase/23S rRNA pseudouridine746 synthase [Cyclobacteriaceae bacterium]|jgi:tRNA pseudouridine32 synthase/23S rRNA pseudouridine746 synthase
MSDNFDLRCFRLLKNEGSNVELKKTLHISTQNDLHPLCQMASEELQSLILSRPLWGNRFGLGDTLGFGKMFGVLAVMNKDGQYGYLSAFSGKLFGSNHHEGFVPPVYDVLSSDSFLHEGMKKVDALNEAIEGQLDTDKVKELVSKRKKLSKKLQAQIPDHYHFVNRDLTEKSLRKVFSDAGLGNPPGGAGECAAPKLLQYAFIHGFTPVALAEFYWGVHTGSNSWKHKMNYEPCVGKCAPILRHMLS